MQEATVRERGAARTLELRRTAAGWVSSPPKRTRMALKAAAKPPDSGQTTYSASCRSSSVIHHEKRRPRNERQERLWSTANRWCPLITARSPTTPSRGAAGPAVRPRKLFPDVPHHIDKHGECSAAERTAAESSPSVLQQPPSPEAADMRVTLTCEPTAVVEARTVSRTFGPAAALSGVSLALAGGRSTRCSGRTARARRRCSASSRACCTRSGLSRWPDGTRPEAAPSASRRPRALGRPHLLPADHGLENLASSPGSTESAAGGGRAARGARVVGLDDGRARPAPASTRTACRSGSPSPARS